MPPESRSARERFESQSYPSLSLEYVEIVKMRKTAIGGVVGHFFQELCRRLE